MAKNTYNRKKHGISRELLVQNDHASQAVLQAKRVQKIYDWTAPSNFADAACVYYFREKS